MIPKDESIPYILFYGCQSYNKHRNFSLCFLLRFCNILPKTDPILNHVGFPSVLQLLT